MKWRQIRLDHLGLVLLLMGMASCRSIPRIVILHDSLSMKEHLQLGVAYESQGFWDLAISEYQAALKKGGSLSLIKGNMGNIYYIKKEYLAAEAAYREALRSDSRNAPILNNLANLYLVQKKNLKKAEGLVQKAIALDRSRDRSHQPVYLETLGSIYLAQGDYLAALVSYEKAEELAPQNSPLKSRLKENKEQTKALLKENNTIPKIEEHSGVR